MQETSVLDGLTYGEGVRDDLVQEESGRIAATGRLAATLVRSRAMPHNPRCKGKCLHRNHRRDQVHLKLLLDILGLDDTQATAGDYDSPLAWASMPKHEYQLMKGSG